MKRLFALLLAVVLLASMSSVSAHAYAPDLNQQMLIDSAMIANPVPASPDELGQPTEQQILNGENGYKVDMSNVTYNKGVADENASYEFIVELVDAPLGNDAQMYNGKKAVQLTAQNKLDLVVKANSLTNKQNQAIVKAKSLDKNTAVLYQYNAVFNGFSAKMTYKAANALKSDPLVKNVYLSSTYEVPTTPSDISSSAMVSANYAWTNGYEGEGKLIAIVDTGIKYTHPLLNNLDAAGRITRDEMKARVNYLEGTIGLAAGTDNSAKYYFNDKVVFGYDYIDIDRDPMDDYVGHGTHVAGIAAANNTGEGLVVGIAPKAQLMAMKVFSSLNGSSSDAAILAGVEDAYKLGADTINLSLGTACGFDTYPEGIGKFDLEQAYLACERNGTFVSSSAGNDAYIGKGSALVDQLPEPMPYADNPEYGTVGSPGTFESSFTVASCDNVNMTLNYFIFNDEHIPFTDTATTYLATKIFDGQTLDYVVVPNFGASADYNELDVTGRIALVSRGGDASISDFRTKASVARSKGAVGVIIRNNVEGIVRAATDYSVTIPLIAIDMASGNKLVEAGGGQVAFAKGFLEMFSAGPSLISSFSSRGVTPGLQLKPDITGVGGNIYSTYIDETGYTSMGGTSMAAPQIAGIATDVREYVEKTFPGFTREEQAQRVKNLLMSSARPMKDETGVYYSVQTQGAGFVDVKGSLEATAILYDSSHRSKVELGDDIGRDVRFDFTLENITGEAKQYKLSAVFMADTPSVFYNGDDLSDSLAYNNLRQTIFENGAAFTATGADLVGDILTVSANGKAKITVDFTISEEDNAEILASFSNGYFINGFVFAAPVEGEYELSIPFLGFVGDWSKAPVFDKSTAYEPVPKLHDLPFYRKDLMYGVSGYLGINSGTGMSYGTEFIAVSPNGDSVLDSVAPLMTLMRNTRDMFAEILDENGSVVNKITSSVPTDTWGIKSYVQSSGQLFATVPFSLTWKGTDSAGKALPDGQYYYRITAHTSEGAAQSRTTPVYLDVTAPQFSTKIYQEDGKCLLEYKVSDNHYLQSVSVSASYTSGLTVQAPNTHDYSVIFDVTPTYEKLGDAMLQNIVVRASDYAGNAISYRLAPVDTTGIQPSFSRIEWSKFDVENMPAEAMIILSGGTNITPENKITATLNTYISGKFTPVPGIIDVPCTFGADKPNFIEIPRIPVLAAGERLVWDIRIAGSTYYRQEIYTTSKWNRSMWENQNVFMDDEGRLAFKSSLLQMPNSVQRMEYMGKTYPVFINPHDYYYIEAPYVTGEQVRIIYQKFADTFYTFNNNLTFTLPAPDAPAPVIREITSDTSKVTDFNIYPVNDVTSVGGDSNSPYYVDYDVTVSNAMNNYLFNFRVDVDKTKLALADVIALGDVYSAGAFTSSLKKYAESGRTGYSILAVAKPSSPISADSETKIARLRFLVLDRSITSADISLNFAYALDINNTCIPTSISGGESSVKTAVLKPSPGILSVSVTTPTIVATLAANLRINVTDDLPASEALTAYLEVDGELLYPTPVVNGVCTMRVTAAPAKSGDYKIVVTGSGGARGESKVTVTEYNTDIWNATAFVFDGKLLVKFNSDMALKNTSACVAISGKLYNAKAQADKRTVEVVGIDVSDLAKGTSVSIKGVKFPELFPSYSFTFSTIIV